MGEPISARGTSAVRFSADEQQAELTFLRRRVAELEAREAVRVPAERALRQSEERLRQSEMKLRTLVEYVPAVIYMDATGELAGSGFVSPQLEPLPYPPR